MISLDKKLQSPSISLEKQVFRKNLNKMKKTHHFWKKNCPKF